MATVAFLWPATASKAVYGVQASLLLLAWLFPRFADALDPTYPLAGLLLHKVKQAGFYRLRASHKFHFAGGKAAKLTKPEIALRKDLWVRCVLAYQSISIAKGHLPSRMIGSIGGMHTETSDRSLSLQLKCQDIVVQCHTAVSDNGANDILSRGQSNAIDIIIRIFDTRLRDVEDEILKNGASGSVGSTITVLDTTILDKFHIYLARLHVRVFSLFAYPSCEHNHFNDPITILLSIARTVVDLMNEIIHGLGYPPSPPNYMINALIIASLTIMRIVKTNSNDAKVTLSEAYDISCSRLARTLSSSPNDTLAKIATILEDLWKQKNVYKRSDGLADVPIPFSSRLGVNLVLDAASRWYDLQSRPQRNGNAYSNIFPHTGEYDSICYRSSFLMLRRKELSSLIVPLSCNHWLG